MAALEAEAKDVERHALTITGHEQEASRTCSVVVYAPNAFRREEVERYDVQVCPRHGGDDELCLWVKGLSPRAKPGELGVEDVQVYVSQGLDPTRGYNEPIDLTVRLLRLDDAVLSLEVNGKLRSNLSGDPKRWGKEIAVRAAVEEAPVPFANDQGDDRS